MFSFNRINLFGGGHVLIVEKYHEGSENNLFETLIIAEL